MSAERYEIGGISLINIRNRVETDVIKAMRAILPEYPAFDNCSICIEDVYALALSRLPSCYVQRGTIVLHKQVEESEIIEMVRYAVHKVIEKPNHSLSKA